MGNAQNSHLERHGSRSSVADLPGLGGGGHHSGRSSRSNLDNVSLLSVDAILTSYERRALGEMEAQAEAGYQPAAGPTTDSTAGPSQHRVSTGSQGSRHAQISPLAAASSPPEDAETARWQEWTSRSDDEGQEEEGDSEGDSELDESSSGDEPDGEPDGIIRQVSDSDQEEEEGGGASEGLGATGGPTSQEEALTTRPDSPTQPQSGDSQTGAHSGPGGRGAKVHSEDGASRSDSGHSDNSRVSDSGDMEPDTQPKGASSDSTTEVGADSHQNQSAPDHSRMESTTLSGGGEGGGAPPDSVSEDSEDEVFSGTCSDTPTSTPLARSRPVSIDDLLDCLQETPVDELEKDGQPQGGAGRGSCSPSPQPILSPPPDAYAQLEDDVTLVTDLDSQHFSHFNFDVPRSEPRSEPVTDLDDDSDDDEFSQALYGVDLVGPDPEKTAARDEMSRLLLQVQTQFGGHVEDGDADSEVSDAQEEEKAPRTRRDSVSSGGEYDTTTMKIKRDADSDSSDDSDSSSDSDSPGEEEKYASSSEDEIIQHITPELIEKVINADVSSVDLFADAKGEEGPATPAVDKDLLDAPQTAAHPGTLAVAVEKEIETIQLEEVAEKEAVKLEKVVEEEVGEAETDEEEVDTIESQQAINVENTAVKPEAGDPGEPEVTIVIVRDAQVGTSDDDGLILDNLKPEGDQSDQGEQTPPADTEVLGGGVEADSKDRPTEVSSEVSEGEDGVGAKEGPAEVGLAVDAVEDSQIHVTAIVLSDNETSPSSEVSGQEGSPTTTIITDIPAENTAVVLTADQGTGGEVSVKPDGQDDQQVLGEGTTETVGSKDGIIDAQSDTRESPVSETPTPENLNSERLTSEPQALELQTGDDAQSVDAADVKESTDDDDVIETIRVSKAVVSEDRSEALSETKDLREEVVQEQIVKAEICKDEIVASEIISEVTEVVAKEEVDKEEVVKVFKDESGKDEVDQEMEKEANEFVKESPKEEKEDEEENVEAVVKEEKVQAVLTAGANKDEVEVDIDSVEDKMDTAVSEHKEEIISAEIVQEDEGQSTETVQEDIVQPTDIVQEDITQPTHIVQSADLVQEDIVQPTEVPHPEAPQVVAKGDEEVKEDVKPKESVSDVPDSTREEEEDGDRAERPAQEAQVAVQVQTPIVAEVTFSQQQFVLETVTEEEASILLEEEEEEEEASEAGPPGAPPSTPEAAPCGQRTLPVIEEVAEDLMDGGTTKGPETVKQPPPPVGEASTPAPLGGSPGDRPSLEHHGYSRTLLRVISKKYPFQPMPKAPEAQRAYRHMMRQIEAEIHDMIHAPPDADDDHRASPHPHRDALQRLSSSSSAASYGDRSPPPPSQLTMATPVPPPSAQHAARRSLPPGAALHHPHPPGGLQPLRSEPAKTTKESKRELKRRESENRKSKKLKKKDKKAREKGEQGPEKENESRMAQLAQEISNFMKLGSLSKEHGSKSDSKKEEKEEKLPPPPPAAPSDYSAPATAPSTGILVQRSVIIHRDERGYGLTVSGDNPVFVQCVKENGAAARVGVQQGDRIMKVNGTLVTSSNHVEVVKLIKSGPYVALTLLGKQVPSSPRPPDPPGGATPGSPPVDAGSDRITGPQPVNDTMNQELRNQKVAFTRMMYEKATSQFENMKAERHLSDAELHDQLRTIRRLEEALYNLTGIPAESHLPGGPRQRKLDSGSDTTFGDDTPGRDVTVVRTHSDNRKRHDDDKHRATSLPTTVAESDPGLAHSPSPGKDGWGPDGHDSNDDYGDEGVPAIIPMMQQSEGGPYSPNQVNIMGAEDDFSDDEEGQVEEHGPFSDLNALKRKWSHLAVFLNYLISNSDPSPLLFYLVTEDYAKGTIKEMKKWAYEIHSTFLVNKAPLRVMVDEAIVANIDNVLLTKADKVDAIQSAFGLARHHAQNEISELLADFRNKCALGLGSLYGTHEISPKDTMERSKELHLVEKYLVPHFERLLDNEEASDRNQAMAYALATVLKQMGCTSGKVGAALERCPSFVAKDKKTFKLKTNKRQIMVRDHSFMPMSYYTSAYCHHCTGVIWGIGNQGYHCQVCETNVHKQCVEAIKESCSAGQKEARKKTKRTSSIMNIIRKPSVVTQPQISSKDSQRWSDDGYTSPGSSSTSLRLPREDDEDDTSDRLQGRVTQMVEQLSPRGGGGDEARSPGTPPRSRSPDPGQDGDNDTRITTPITKLPKKKHVVRSESLKGSKEAKSKTVRRSQSDLHVDDPSVKNVLNQSGSDTSIAGSLESPSNSSERLADREAYLRQAREDDSDLDVENELPPLSASLPADLVKKLKPKEKKRQDVMNELLHTERTHVRTIKVMQRVFYNHMMAEGISLDLARLLFPNIEELVQCHCSLSNSFKARKKENPQVSHVGDLLLNRFSGEAGEKFKTACATFCRSQSHALEMLRVRQRKDQKLAMFLQEASVNPLCRRLELKDLIPTVMQRLTKYPLLMENLLKYTQAGTEEHGDLNKALVCSRDILSYVNEAVKEFENQQRLRDIQKRLDKKSFENSNLPIVSEFKNLDLTQHTMVYNGQLTWRIGRTKQIELHVVLLEDILVLLQRQDDKYVLKCSTTVVSGREDAKYTHSPVLKLSNVLARNVAVDKRAFFLVCTSDIGPQIYELHAMSAEEKNKWLRYISEAVDAYKERTQKQPHKTPGLPAALGDDKGRVRKESKEEPSDGEGLEAYRSSSVDSLEKATVTTNQADLIQPTEVVISDTVLEERAQPVLSPREMLKRKDEVIRQSLDEKDRLVAEILHVPPGEYSTIAEMASDIEGDKDMRELVLGATYQMSRLTSLVNDSLTVPADDEADVPEEPVSPAPGASASRSVTLPAASVLTVTKKLSEQLTLLLSLVGDQEEQNKRLQRELEVANEQLVLARGAGPHRSPSNSFSRHSRPNSFASITSSTSEVAETPEEAQQLASSSDETGPFPASTSPADVTVTAMYDVNKLEVVEADDANHNVDATLTLTTTPTDANSNRPPDDEGSAT